jgi:hypothetical protein
MSMPFNHLAVLTVGIAIALTGCDRHGSPPEEARPTLNVVRLETITFLPPSAETENAPRIMEQYQSKETPCR